MKTNDPYLAARNRLHELEGRLARGGRINPDELITAAIVEVATAPTTAAGALVKLQDLRRHLAIPGNHQEPWEYLAKHYVAKALSALKRLEPSSALYLRAALATLPPNDRCAMAVALRTACEPLLAPSEALAA